MAPMPEQIELHFFLAKLAPVFDSLVSKKNITFNVDVAPGLFVTADPAHLHQILINLFSNAVKYNRIKGEIFLRFYKSQDNRNVVIEVQDTGIGVSAEKLSKLFTEYFRADLSQSNPVEGDGLGLAFVKKLVELHHGVITVESKADSGSTFTISLPLLPPPVSPVD